MAAKKRAATRKKAASAGPARAGAASARPRSTSRRARAEAPAGKRGALSGGMTVREAGRKGGLIGGRKGGETVKAERGVEFFQQIGRKGGQKVRELIEAGRAAMDKADRRSGRR